MSKWVCPNCNRVYAQQAGLSRHKRSCKFDAYQSEKPPVTDNVHGQLMVMMERMYEQMKVMEQEIRELKLRNSTVTNNTSINTTDSSSTTIAPCTNITINQFGVQDRSYIGEKFLHTCVRQKVLGIVELAKAVHFHPDHQENHNIRAGSLTSVDKQNRLQVHNGKQWEYADLKDVLTKVFNMNYQILDEHLNDNADLLRSLYGEHTFRITNQWYDVMRNCNFNSSRDFKDAIHKLKLMVLSNSGLIK